MLRTNKSLQAAALILSLLAALVPGASAQKRGAAAQTTGGIRGRVRVDAGATASNVRVIVRRGEEEVTHTATNSKGEFEVQGLAPGSYGLTLRKAGLQVGRMSDIEVRAGKTVSLKDGLFLPIDEGAIAHLRGSVFDPNGLSVRGVKVELARLLPDGTARKLDSRVTNSAGSFAFRLPPEAARYRVTVKAGGMEAVKDVDVEGAAIFRVALNLGPAAK